MARFEPQSVKLYLASDAVVHRAHQHEAAGVGDRAGHARDRDLAVLEGLAQHLQHVAAELRQLVEEENARVGQTDLAGTRRRAAAGEAGAGHRVVRRAEGAHADDRVFSAREPRDGVDLRRLDHLLAAHIRQDGGETSRHHRLAGARRPDAEDIVPARGGHLEGALDALLPLDVGVIRQRELRRADHGRGGGLEPALALQMSDELAHVLQRDDLHALGKGRLGSVLGREIEAFDAAALGGDGHRQRAGDAAQRPVKRELAQEGAAAVDAGQLALRGEDADEDRQIVERAGFFPICRREIDRQTARREAEAVVFDRRAHALAGLLDGRVGQPDDLKAGQAAGDIDLHGDLEAAYAADAEAADSR